MRSQEELKALITAAHEEHMVDCLMAEFAAQDYERALQVKSLSGAKLQSLRKQLIALEAEVSHA